MILAWFRNILARLWQGRAFEWLASGSIVQDYARVLAYPKFALSESYIHELLNEDILPSVVPVPLIDVPAVILEDPSDDPFLACATQDQADTLVSGNRHLLDLKTNKTILIINLKSFFLEIQT